MRRTNSLSACATACANKGDSGSCGSFSYSYRVDKNRDVANCILSPREGASLSTAFDLSVDPLWDVYEYNIRKDECNPSGGHGSAGNLHSHFNTIVG